MNEIINYFNNQYRGVVRIEVEGKADKLILLLDELNESTGSEYNLDSDGVTVLDPDVSKFGTQFRLYFENCDNSTEEFRREVTNNRAYRNEFIFRINRKENVKPLLFLGFSLGDNSRQ